MYSAKKKKNNIKLLDSKEITFYEINGLVMTSKKGFKIQDQVIKNLKVVENDIAQILAKEKAISKYNKLIGKLTELLCEDDDTGDVCHLVLDQVEKFRLEVKNKYRDYLSKEELTKMSKKLAFLKNEANKKLLQIYDYNSKVNTSRKSK